MLIEIPNGLQEILEVFGDSDSNDFERDHIVLFRLPYTLWYGGIAVNRSRCHKLAVDNFTAVFEAILNAGLKDSVQHYGGIFAQRKKRGSQRRSTHSWGIAIDLEPQEYPLGSSKRFPQEIIDIFHKYGFMYGGDFSKRKDPMHFQLCTGY